MKVLKRDWLYLCTLFSILAVIFFVVKPKKNDLVIVEKASIEKTDLTQPVPPPSADDLRVRSISLVAEDGSVQVKLSSGNPPVLEVKDSKGKIVKINLTKLVERLSW